MKFQLPAFDVVGTASDLIQGPPVGTSELDLNGIPLYLPASNLEEQ